MSLRTKYLYPLGAISKKQTAVSHSTPEAELVSANLAMRTEGLPAICLWSVLAGLRPPGPNVGNNDPTTVGNNGKRPKDIELRFDEDNQAAYTVVKKGYSTTMRDLSRLHSVSLASLHNVYFQKPMAEVCKLVECTSDEQKADIFTKSFKTVDAWLKALAKVALVWET